MPFRLRVNELILITNTVPLYANIWSIITDGAIYGDEHFSRHSILLCVD